MDSVLKNDSKYRSDLLFYQQQSLIILILKIIYLKSIRLEIQTYVEKFVKLKEGIRNFILTPRPGFEPESQARQACMIGHYTTGAN